MEPKEECPIDNNLDLILVPTVGISPAGVRLGYGHGFYDKFLAENKSLGNNYNFINSRKTSNQKYSKIRTRYFN